ncbi:FmdB family zinc ribbon protein [Zwartia panacis]|uniref:FmdB family zinc ribbon protein n=1 Tax=Zwartia panacis TaxID=2683345 RepID=UPI0025B52F33|nr:FmdB family zinc ribbon protein [Zwartia panacis]MDN4018073.1 zinc ribbon domain-containing protein [Zwartia panacis]
MPIYAYKCTACGHAQDVLQKISDKPLTVCPECHQETYAKQVTAAGFQLKGSGWYVTDFRNNGGGDKGSSKTSEPAPAVTAADSAATSSASTGSEGGSAGSGGSGSSTSAPAAASASSASTTGASTSSAASSKPATGGSAA